MAERFYKVYDEVLADSELSYPEMILYGVIVRLSQNNERRCFASNQALANIMRCSKSSISKWLDTLSRRGYIKRWVHYAEGTKHVDKRYITPVTIYPADLQEDIPQNDNRGSLSDRTRYTADLQEGIPPDYKDSKKSLERENSKSNEERDLVRKRMTDALYMRFFSVTFNEAVLKWIDYRISKGGFINCEWFAEQTRLMKIILNSNHDESEIISILEESIANNSDDFSLAKFWESGKSNNFFLRLMRQNRN